MIEVICSPAKWVDAETRRAAPAGLWLPVLPGIGSELRVTIAGDTRSWRVDGVRFEVTADPDAHPFRTVLTLSPWPGT